MTRHYTSLVPGSEVHRALDVAGVEEVDWVLLQLADLQRVGAGLGQEPVVPERGEGRGDGLQPRTQVALAVLPPRPRGHAPPRRAAHAARAAAAAGGGEVGWLGVVQRLEEDGRGDVLRVV